MKELDDKTRHALMEDFRVVLPRALWYAVMTALKEQAIAARLRENVNEAECAKRIMAQIISQTGINPVAVQKDLRSAAEQMGILKAGVGHVVN